MKSFPFPKYLLVMLPLAAAVALYALSRHRRIDFNSEVKPIFNKKCITCHGGVRKKANFSLLFRADAFARTESGKPAIVPGDPDHSEMIRRLTLKDPEERMPYRHDALTRDEVNILREWIRQGAPWGEHWAYAPVREPEPPAAGFLPGTESRGANNIDRYVLKHLKEKELQPSSGAPGPVLLRRVSLDLTGLPAPAALAKKFLTNPDGPGSYEELVDSLLASPHYGERWAALWLDLARYADTKGYERDAGRSIWRYRDWLIHAFNEDKPYDRFLTEQLAGDLLPQPSEDQYIATAFHRNTMTNDEGGTDNEEFRTAAVMDRVNTTWEALMGTTFACVQCHSHPYDPFRHEDYYHFLAFFNDSRDEDTEADYPLLRHFNDSARQELATLTAWLGSHSSPGQQAALVQFLKTWQPALNSLTCDRFNNSELSDTKWLAFRNHASCRLRSVMLDGKNSLVFRYMTAPAHGTWEIHTDSLQGPLLARIDLGPAPFEKGWKSAEAPIRTVTGTHDLWFSYVNPLAKDPLQNLVMFDWFWFTQSFPGKGDPRYAEMKKRYEGLRDMNTPTTPIMMDNPVDLHRNTQVFERGNWLVRGARVEPDVPHSLHPFPAGAPHNRLGLAAWITDKKNPLTSRTMVNRIWEQLFGTGLVETLEDLGTQGSPPVYEDLLDYLAYRFMNADQWSTKKLLREIVLSGVYRQDSRLNARALEKDPANKFLARGPRVRLSAEQIRDQALSITGMLNEKMYGPSVMPYQPDGIWLSPWNGQYWVNSQGGEKYRRALYTYWKRTAPYPSMMTFDGAAREVCTARRIRTNTPLQALVTLNDEAYLDMARHWVWKLQSRIPKSSDLIRYAYESATGHGISPGVEATLEKLYGASLQVFRANPEKACKMAGGNSTRYDSAATAALVVVANTILNLDEIITKN
jgi:hypothetical protein